MVKWKKGNVRGICQEMEMSPFEPRMSYLGLGEYCIQALEK
jgi:hypothetical protein